MYSDFINNHSSVPGPVITCYLNNQTNLNGGHYE